MYLLLMLFILYILVYLITILKIIIYKRQKNYGLHLSRNWIYFVVVFEFVYLLTWWGYLELEYADNISLIWGTYIVYFRGILLSWPFLAWLDASLPVFFEVMYLYIFALIFDYLTFTLVSCIKDSIINRRK